MNITIDQLNNSISYKSTPSYSNERGGKKLHIIGDLLSIYDKKGKRFLSKEASYSKLEDSLDDVNLRESLIRNGVGVFWVVIQDQNEVNIYASIKSPGFFYMEKENVIHCCSSERAFYKEFIKYGLAGYDVLHHLTNNFLFRSPFSSLINGSKRIIGGQKLTVSPGKLSSGFYLDFNNFCSEKRSETELIDEYSNLIENQIKLNYDAYKRENNLVLISGGIDSTMILLAAWKLGLEFTPTHFVKSDELCKNIRVLCEDFIKQKPLFVNYCADINDRAEIWDKQIQIYEQLYGQGLGMMSIKSIFSSIVFKELKPFSMGGIFCGLMYQGNAAMLPSFGLNNMNRRIQDTIYHKPLRFLYTELFLRLLGSFNLNLLNKLYKPHALPNSMYEYFQFLTLNQKGPMRWEAPLLPHSLKKIENDYMLWRTQAILEPIFGQVIVNSDLHLNISPHDATKYVRLLRHSTNFQCGTLNLYNEAQAGLFSHHDPPIDGPMVEFLYSLPLTIDKVLHPKKLQFMYFEKVLGKQYYRDYIHKGQSIYDYIPSKYKRYGYLKKIKNFARKSNHKKPSSSSVNKSNSNNSNGKINYFDRNYYIKRPEFHDFMIDLTNTKSSALLDNIKDPLIKDYAFNLYRSISDGENNNFIQINQVMNLEYFLREVS